MKGDPFLFEEHQKNKVKHILPIILHRLQKTEKPIITIGGISGTSKSEIAVLLQEELYKLKITSLCISLDDYYKTNWRDRNKIRKQKGIDYVGINEITWTKLKQIAKAFKTNKKKLYLQEINKYSDSMEYYVAQANKIQVLIIEGLYSNYLKIKDFGIFLDATIEDTYSFRKQRAKEKINSFREAVLEKEMKDVKKTKNLADIIIPYKLEIK